MQFPGGVQEILPTANRSPGQPSKGRPGGGQWLIVRKLGCAIVVAIRRTESGNEIGPAVRSRQADAPPGAVKTRPEEQMSPTELSAECQEEDAGAGLIVAADLASGALTNTDIANGERLIRQHGHKLRYCHKMRSWFIYDGRRWRPDDTAEIESLAQKTAISIIDEARAEPDDAKRSVLLKHALQSEGAGRVEAMIKQARSNARVRVTTAELDTNPWLLNCPNGTVCLKTGELLNHHEKNLITRLCPTVYDPKATCPEWDKFLAAVFLDDAELIAYVRRLFGYATTGDTSEHFIAVLFGDGANGKSVLTRTISAVLGSDYATTAAPDLLIAKANSTKHLTGQAMLFGRRLVIASESVKGARLEEETVKRLV
jgi:putative DNA primase/helicase